MRRSPDQQTTAGGTAAAHTDDVPRGGPPGAHRLTWVVVGLLALTWLGVNASWGLTDPGDTLVSAWLRTIRPVEEWLLAVTVILAGATVLAARQRNRAMAVFGAMMLAYLGGVWLAGALDSQVTVRGSLAFRRFTERSFQLIPAVPMLGVWCASRGSVNYLRWGSWTGPSSVATMGDRSLTWRVLLFAWLAMVALPAAFVMQAQVGFAPWLNGSAWGALAPLSTLALLNAFIEELLFRGLIQSSLVAAVGSPAGVWLQAVFFGIHHWGASPGLAAAFPMAVLTVCLGIVWGRSVLETKGLGWAICAHATLDLGFFLVQFLPSG